ncbi:hypothetical protein BpHYR1_025697 [Brachionus plicatilis]|uniref:Uncharacterized protein n=1 Tax=Brachionus plicatilis TaxID=10195 RepID=A0A3M7RI08_BRAPC|nr:hypothetical protein BpHYR1_025697 [Brachionus plicatilis]
MLGLGIYYGSCPKCDKVFTKNVIIVNDFVLKFSLSSSSSSKLSDSIDCTVLLRKTVFTLNFLAPASTNLKRKGRREEEERKKRGKESDEKQKNDEQNVKNYLIVFMSIYTIKRINYIYTINLKKPEKNLNLFKFSRFIVLLTQ